MSEQLVKPKDKKQKQNVNSIIEREGNKITFLNGSILFQCLICKQNNRDMFFASESDLELHNRKRHGVG